MTGPPPAALDSPASPASVTTSTASVTTSTETVPHIEGAVP